MQLVNWGWLRSLDEACGSRVHLSFVSKCIRSLIHPQTHAERLLCTQHGDTVGIQLTLLSP